MQIIESINRHVIYYLIYNDNLVYSNLVNITYNIYAL